MAITVASTNYFAVHARIGRRFGKPSLCEFCGRTDAKRFEWAVKHGCEMNDARSSWLRLCTSCHRRYDQTDEWRANNAAARLGKSHTPEHNRRIAKRLTEGDVSVIRGRLAAGETTRTLAVDFCVSQSLVSMISTGKRWGWVR